MVIAFDVLLSDLTAMTLELPYTEQGGVSLLSAEGKLLGLPRGAGFDTPDAIRKAVLKTPAEVGLDLIDEALKAELEVEAGPLGNVVRARDGRAWRVKYKPMPLRNQPFQMALMAPNDMFVPWFQRFVWGLWLAFGLLLAGGAFMVRRLRKHVAEPVRDLFEQLAAGNRQLEEKGLHAEWLATIATQLQKAADPHSLGQTLLSGLTRFVQLGYGSLYVADDGQQSLKAAGFALEGALQLPPDVAYGSGLLGQCAREQRVCALTGPATATSRCNLLTAGVPACLLFLPVKSSEVLLGVVELALLKLPSTHDEALLNELMPTLAMCLEILEKNADTRRLLDETRMQAVALQENEGRIKEAEERMRTLLELSPVGCSIATAQGVSVFRNQRLAGMLGIRWRS